MWPFKRSQSKSLEEIFKGVEVKSYSSNTGFNAPKASTPTRDEAMRYVTFARVVDTLSTQIADLIETSLHVVDRESGGIVSNPETQRILSLIQDTPDEFHSGHEFMREVIADYLVDGNGLILIDEQSSRMSGRIITALHRLESDSAKIKVDKNNSGPKSMVYDAVKFGFGVVDTYPARRVVHARFMSRGSVGQGTSNGRVFFSPSCLEKMARAIRIGLMGDAWVDAFFDQAAKSSMIIRVPESVSPEQLEEIIKSYETYVKSGRAPLILTAGADAKLINPNPQEADTLNLREYSVQEIGRFYGLVAPILGVHVTQWGSGIEQLARLHSRFCLRPQLTKILSALSMRLLPKNQRFDVDFTQELRGDTAAMTALMSAMRPSTNNPGLASRGELRGLYGFRGDYEDDYGDWAVNVNKKGGNETSGQDDNTMVDSPADNDNGDNVDAN